MTSRTAYLGQLSRLEEEIAGMATLVREAYRRASDAATTGNVENPVSLDSASSDIASQEREVETLALRILLLQQPVAGDLRDVSGALKMVTDLKRIGDLSLDVCRIVLEMGGTTFDLQKGGIADMAALVREMVSTAIDSYLGRDVKKALRAAGLDDEADACLVRLRDDIVGRLVAGTMAAEDAVNLLMIAKYFERIGDHAESVAYWTEYVVQGTRRGEPFVFNGER